jgi:hypothetical protein
MCSMASGFLTSTPRAAPFPAATMMDIGVARPRAQWAGDVQDGNLPRQQHSHLRDGRNGEEQRGCDLADAVCRRKRNASTLPSENPEIRLPEYAVHRNRLERHRFISLWRP